MIIIVLIGLLIIKENKTKNKQTNKNETLKRIQIFNGRTLT